MDADIAGAFDNISHDHILRAIAHFPARELVRQWLKAGYVEKGALHETEAGIGQGAVVSPLLANIALHGMEEALGVTHDRKGYISGTRAPSSVTPTTSGATRSLETARRKPTGG